MRTILFISVILLSSAFFLKKDNDIFKPIKHDSFITGENLQFKLNYGIFTVGKAQMNIFPGYFNIDDRKCYKVDIYGQTSGITSWVTKIDDNWGAFVDSAALLPLQTWRKLREGRYKKDELVNFNHKNNTIEVKEINQRTGFYKDSEYFKAPNNVKDLIGSFLYLRSVDYSDLKKGDTLKMHTFFEDTIYDFRIMYRGKEIVKTKLGKFNAIKLVPIMPDNDLFDGENSVTFWLSDDKNKLPIKAEVKMFIGRAGCEITGFENIKHNLNLIRDD